MKEPTVCDLASQSNSFKPFLKILVHLVVIQS